ncbi:MAG TPA: hypothetical protein VID73_12920 [Ktedonobacterales bacterium]
MPRVSAEQARAIFGNAAPPARVTERQFDGFDAELRALAQTPLDAITPHGLWYYLHDLAAVDLQPDLFAYLFPACLTFWYDSLLRNQDSAQGDAEFHAALARGRILQTMVTPAQRERILDYLHDGFLDRLDLERGFNTAAVEAPAFSWMRRFNSLALVVPLIERLWTAWWRMETAGQAVAALLYASALMYRRGENPLFPALPHSPASGVPPLWENDSALFDDGWLPENLAFLRRTLTVEYLGQQVAAAARRLTGEPEEEMAAVLARDYELRANVVASRGSSLLDLLAQPAPCAVDW